jgi:5,6-dimethylbenzimidazole synthase
MIALARKHPELLDAYLCLGYVDAFLSQPELETVGWLPRLPPAEASRFETQDGRSAAA